MKNQSEFNKWILLAITLIYSCFVCSAQSVKFSERKDKGTFYGVKSAKGKVLVPAIYDFVSEIKNHKNDVFFLLKDYRGYRSLVNENGKTLIKLGDYSYIGFLPFSDDYIVVKSQGKRGVYDIHGKNILPVDFDGIFIETSKSNGEHIPSAFSVELAGKKGLYSLKGDNLVPIAYDYIDSYSPNCDFINIKSNNKYGTFDIKTHKEIIPPLYISVGQLSPNCFYVRDDFRTVSLIINGEKVFTGTGGYIEMLNDSNYEVHYGGKSGFIDRSNSRDYYIINNRGNIIEEWEYNPKSVKFTSDYDKSVYSYISDNNYYWGVTSINGEIIVPTKFHDVRYDHNANLFYVYNSQSSGVYNIDGTEIVPLNKYDAISFNTRTRFFDVESNGYVGLVDSIGSEIIPPTKYHEIEKLTSDSPLYRVKYNGRYGIIDGQLNEVIPPIYESVKLTNRYPAIGPHFIVSLNGRKGLFSVSGISIIPPSFTNISIHDPKYYGGDKSWIETSYYQYRGAYDLQGNEIIPINQYTKILLNEKFTSMAHFDVWDSAGRTGLFDLEGNVLFPLSNFKVLGINADAKSSTGHVITAMEGGVFDRTITFELYTGKILSDNKKEVDLYNYIKYGNQAFDSGDYKNAIKNYGSVTNCMGISE